MINRWIEKLPLAVIAAVLLCVASWFSSGYHHFDEHFQILEFASWKAGDIPAEQLAWEFHERMRPTLQPTIAYFTISASRTIGIDSPFIQAWILRLLSALLTFITIRTLWQYQRGRFEGSAFSMLGFFLFTGWLLLYNGVRFSSENWSGLFAVLGALVVLKNQSVNTKSSLYAGILFGIAFLCRYQVGFMILGFGAWMLFVNRSDWSSLFKVLLGILITIFLGIALDSWFYGESVISPYAYLEQNIFEDKVSGFGIEPWYYYFTKSIERLMFLVGSLIWIGLFSLVIKKPKDVFLWMIVPFILIHSVIGHKEIRFLFPLILFMPYLLAQAVELIIHQFGKAGQSIAIVCLTLTVLVNVPLLAYVCLSPADEYQGMYKAVYEEEPSQIYVLGDMNPYERVTLPLSFYRPKSLNTIAPYSSEQPTDGSLLITEGTLAPEGWGLVYSQYPDWLSRRYNYFDWISKTRNVMLWKPSSSE